MNNLYYMGVYALISAMLSYGIARMFFGRAAERGMGASQWLFVGLIFFVMMLLFFFYERYLKFII